MQRRFKLLDWIVIFMTADLMATCLLATLAGYIVAALFFTLLAVAWFLYEGYVEYQIQEGLR